MDRADAILTRFSDKNLPLLGAEIGVLKGENALRLLSSHDKLILHLCSNKLVFGFLVRKVPQK